VLPLRREVPVDQHRQQPVRGRGGHPEPLRGLAHRQRALDLQHDRELERVVDAADRIVRRILHSRISWSSSVRTIQAGGMSELAAESDALAELYRGFERELLVPLWTEIGDLMPARPRSKAVPHLWKWDALLKLADQAGHLVPVGRGGERRAIAL